MAYPDPHSLPDTLPKGKPSLKVIMSVADQTIRFQSMATLLEWLLSVVNTAPLPGQGDQLAGLGWYVGRNREWHRLASESAWLVCDLYAWAKHNIDVGSVRNRFRDRGPTPDEFERAESLVEGAIRRIADALPEGLRDDVLGSQEPDLQAATQKGGPDPADLQAVQRELGPDSDEIDRIIDEEFDGFRLVSELGRGSFGTVYRARPTAPVGPSGDQAIKILKGMSESGETLQRFRREQALLARLAGRPGIVNILWSGRTPSGRAYFVMDLIDGPTLHAHMRAGRATVSDVMRLMLRVCRAVGEAHRAGIVHRDITPRNILIAKSADGVGAPWLVDFGVASALDRGMHPDSLCTSQGVRVGTPAYMSPEQLDGDPDRIGPPSDVYALGVILYEMLTGIRPLNTDDLPGSGQADRWALASHLKRRTFLPPGEQVRMLARRQPLGVAAGCDASEIDGAVDAIVLCCLSEQPRQRYPDAAALADDLSAWLGGGALRVAVPGPVARLAGRGQTIVRRAWRVAPIRATVVLSAVMLGAWTVVHYVGADGRPEDARETVRLEGIARQAEVDRPDLAPSSELAGQRAAVNEVYEQYLAHQKAGRIRLASLVLLENATLLRQFETAMAEAAESTAAMKRALAGPLGSLSSVSWGVANPVRDGIARARERAWLAHDAARFAESRRILDALNLLADAHGDAVRALADGLPDPPPEGVFGVDARNLWTADQHFRDAAEELALLIGDERAEAIAPIMTRFGTFLVNGRASAVESAMRHASAVKARTEWRDTWVTMDTDNPSVAALTHPIEAAAHRAEQALLAWNFGEAASGFETCTMQWQALRAQPLVQTALALTSLRSSIGAGLEPDLDWLARVAAQAGESGLTGIFADEMQDAWRIAIDRRDAASHLDQVERVLAGESGRLLAAHLPETAALLRRAAGDARAEMERHRDSRCAGESWTMSREASSIHNWLRQAMDDAHAGWRHLEEVDARVAALDGEYRRLAATPPFGPMRDAWREIASAMDSLVVRATSVRKAPVSVSMRELAAMADGLEARLLEYRDAVLVMQSQRAAADRLRAERAALIREAGGAAVFEFSDGMRAVAESLAQADQCYRDDRFEHAIAVYGTALSDLRGRVKSLAFASAGVRVRCMPAAERRAVTVEIRQDTSAVGPPRALDFVGTGVQLISGAPVLALADGGLWHVRVVGRTPRGELSQVAAFRVSMPDPGMARGTLELEIAEEARPRRLPDGTEIHLPAPWHARGAGFLVTEAMKEN